MPRTQQRSLQWRRLYRRSRSYGWIGWHRKCSEYRVGRRPWACPGWPWPPAWHPGPRDPAGWWPNNWPWSWWPKRPGGVPICHPIGQRILINSCIIKYNWSTRPATVLAGSDHYFRTCCPSVHLSVRSFQNSQNQVIVGWPSGSWIFKYNNLVSFVGTSPQCCWLLEKEEERIACW